MPLLSSLRARPYVLDGALAGLVTAMALLESAQPGRGWAHPAVMVPGALLVTVPLAARRLAPVPVLLVGLGAALVVALVATTPASATLFLAGLIELYTVATRCSRRTILLAVPLVLVVAGVTLARDPATTAPVEALPTFGVTAAVLMLALVVRRSRDQAQRLRLLADELAESRATGERLAISAERLRISREMHDVLAHSISVMVLQTGAARMSLADTAPAVRTMLAGVEDVGREALGELRGVLGLLREPGTSGADLAPPQGDLGRLVETMRGAGLAVTVHGDDALAGVAPSVAQAVFRTVQEALTNCLKHAPGARTTVEIDVQENRVVVAVRDTGGSAPAPALEGAGHGLHGIRERVLALGGSVSSGPQADGGWVVRAELPCLGAPLGAGGLRP
ncbi:signal transduction histidine kinase [Motilibacter rhizosphaerae]|uniref:histidine kinase n=1 Tax=Motilibacter rhizosphaerae TaxID=598652 RepID=A0A4Q7NX35_9ACTN|nr:histidine kinase [Motilibacter rhizosphaerae]RZS91815.1 signal transduction histidine kinase [Motilibacter rhizosphaerae]